MSAATAIPGNTAATFLTHFFGPGLADSRYVIGRFRTLADGDIRRCPDPAPKRGRTRRAKAVTATLKALLDGSPGAQLLAVGDDWQAIYRFGGSDIAVMREFGERFGKFERIDLGTTFRCADRISAVATDFVLRNPAQIRKTVRATRRAEGPAVHVGLPGEGGLSLLKEALDRIDEDAASHEGTSDVLLLGRYRHLKPLNLDSLAKQHPRLRFSYMTVHRAKGLEADYVVVLGLCSGRFGFPVEITDDPLLDLVMAAPEAHPKRRGKAAALRGADACAPAGVPACRGGRPFRVRDGTDRRQGTGEGVRPSARRRRGVSAVQGGAPGTPRKRPRRDRFLRLLELAPLRAHGASMPEVRCRPACQVGQRLSLPGLRRLDRGMPGLRRLAGDQDGAVRSLPWVLQLPGMRIHAEPETARSVTT